MSEITWGALSLVAGIGLGTVFFGGLWWTVRRGLQSKCAPLWFAVGLPVRIGIVLGGLYWVNGGHWDRPGHLDRLISCVAGMVVSRYLIVFLTAGDQEVSEPVVSPEAPYAS